MSVYGILSTGQGQSQVTKDLYIQKSHSGHVIHVLGAIFDFMVSLQKIKSGIRKIENWDRYLVELLIFSHLVVFVCIFYSKMRLSQTREAYPIVGQKLRCQKTMSNCCMRTKKVGQVSRRYRRSFLSYRKYSGGVLNAPSLSVKRGLCFHRQPHFINN